MARYIDAEPLEKEQYKGFDRASETEWQKGYWAGIDEMCEKIKAQPTADVVEVVRCKDCVYRKVNFLATAAICEKVLHTIENETDFCSYGKKVE